MLHDNVKSEPTRIKNPLYVTHTYTNSFSSLWHGKVNSNQWLSLYDIDSGANMFSAGS